MGVGSRPPLPLYCVELLTLNFPAGGVRTAIDTCSIAFAVASTHFRPSTSHICLRNFALLRLRPLGESAKIEVAPSEQHKFLYIIYPYVKIRPPPPYCGSTIILIIIIQSNLNFTTWPSYLQALRPVGYTEEDFKTFLSIFLRKNMTPRNCAPTPSPAYHDLNISKSILLVDASTQISGFLAEWMFGKILKDCSLYYMKGYRLFYLIVQAKSPISRKQFFSSSFYSQRDCIVLLSYKVNSNSLNLLNSI